MKEWIRCSEEMPDAPRSAGYISRSVLVRTKGDDYAVAYYDYDRHSWYDNLTNDLLFSDAGVTHWMPIPADKDVK